MNLLHYHAHNRNAELCKRQSIFSRCLSYSSWVQACGRWEQRAPGAVLEAGRRCRGVQGREHFCPGRQGLSLSSGDGWVDVTSGHGWAEGLLTEGTVWAKGWETWAKTPSLTAATGNSPPCYENIVAGKAAETNQGNQNPEGFVC